MPENNTFIASATADGKQGMSLIFSNEKIE